MVVREEREAEEARRKEEEEERLQKAQEAARAKRARLALMRCRGARVWNEVEREIDYKNASGYDRAVELLLDLRSLAGESGTEIAFAERVESIRDRHQRKRAFISRLEAHRIGIG